VFYFKGFKMLRYCFYSPLHVLKQESKQLIPRTYR